MFYRENAAFFVLFQNTTYCVKNYHFEFLAQNMGKELTIEVRRSTIKRHTKGYRSGRRARKTGAGKIFRKNKEEMGYEDH